MKKQTNTSRSTSLKSTAELTYSEFLVRARRAGTISAHRTIGLRALRNINATLKAALSAQNFDNEEVTASAYRVLGILSRTLLSGPSCYIFIGDLAVKFATLTSALEDIVETMVENLRSGNVTGDGKVPQNLASVLLKLESVLDSSYYGFSCEDSQLASVQRKDVTLSEIKNLATSISDSYYDIPYYLIEDYLLAHAYCYNLSLTE